MQEYEKEKLSGAGTGAVAYRELRTGPIRAESGCDHILPDYMGDVKKLLYFGTKLIPAGSYASGNESSHSGIAAHTALYYDSDGTLTEASFTSGYEFDAKCAGEAIAVYAKTASTGVSVRLQGPRKMSAKVGLCSEVFSLTEDDTPTVEHSDSLECEKKTVKLHRAAYISGGEREYAEEGPELTGITADMTEVVASGADLKINGHRCDNDGLTVYGIIEAYALIRINGEDVSRLVGEIPFEQNVGQCPPAGAAIIADGYVTSVSVGVNDTDADIDREPSCRVVFSVSAEFFARADMNEERDLITDAYSTDAMTELEYRDFEYFELCESLRGEERVGIDIPLPEGASACKSIVFLTAQPHPTGYICDGSSIKMTYECDVTAVLSCASGEPYISVKAQRPMEIILPMRSGADRGDLEIIPRLEISETEGAINGSSVCVRLLARANAAALERKRIRAVSSVRLDSHPEKEEAQPRVIVYYPDSGDTLWSVCKKYGVRAQDVARENSLGAEAALDPWSKKSLEGIESLIVSGF